MEKAKKTKRERKKTDDSVDKQGNRTFELYHPDAEEIHAEMVPKKVWELLRRNPIFRAKCHALIILVADLPRTLSRIRRLFNKLDRQNPVASYVLRWCLVPRWIRMHPRPEERWSEPWAGSEKMENSFIFEESDIWRWEGILKKKGKLQSLKINGPFSLDTEWTKTPELFRLHFDWILKAFYLHSPPPDYVGTLVEEPTLCGGIIEIKEDGSANQRLDQTNDAPPIFRGIDPEEFKLIAATHVFLAIPKIPVLHTVRIRVGEDFKVLLDEMKCFSAQLLPHFLGTPAQWEQFTCIHTPDLYWLEKESCKWMRKSLSGGIKKFVETKGHKGVRAAQIRKNYEFIERMMNSLFPNFSWTDVIRISFEDPTIPEPRNFEMIKAFSTQKVQGLCQFCLDFYLSGKNVGRRSKRVR